MERTSDPVQKSGAPYFGEGRNEWAPWWCLLTSRSIRCAGAIEKIRGRLPDVHRAEPVGIWRAEYRQPIPVDLPIDQQVELLLDTGIIVECNDFMARMYGHSDRADLIGRRIRDFYYIENNLDEQKTRELMSAYIQNNYRVSKCGVERTRQTRQYPLYAEQ